MMFDIFKHFRSSNTPTGDVKINILNNRQLTIKILIMLFLRKMY